MFKDWPSWLLSRFGLARKSGTGKFRMRDGSEFTIDFARNNIGTFQEVWLMNFYEKKYRLKPGDRVIDIGASIGVFSVLAAKRGAQVYAYEPTPLSFDLLVQNTRNYNVTPYNLAVTGDVGTAELFISTGDEGNTLIRPKTPSQSIRVPTTTLDQIINQVGTCNLLKIDCEGGEVAILKNTKLETFDHIENIAMEYHRNLPEVLSIFRKTGYKVTTEGADYGYLYASR